MPVEIEELVIRVVVTPPDWAGGGSRPAETDSESRDELVSEVLEQVLAVLRQKEER